MENYYEILGINEKATASEIKRAYFKMIRKYSPEKDEKNFKRVREAYEVLRDPVTKGEYDEMMVISPILRNNFLQAKEEMEHGSFSHAIERLKEILRYQEVDLVRAALADAYLLNGNTGNAIKIYEELVNKHPAQNVYKSKLGSAYVMRGWHKKAIPIIKEALRHDEEDVGNWLLLAEAYMKANEIEKSIDILESGLQKNFELEFQNILLFSKWQKQIMWWGLCGEDLEQEQNIIQEIKTHVAKVKAETSQDDEARQMLADILMNLCQIAVCGNCFEVARVCINRIQILIPLDKEMKEAIKQFEIQINMGAEIQIIYEDEEMDEDFLELIVVYIMPYEVLDISKAEYEFGRMMCATELAMHYKRYAAQLKRLKEKYPKLYVKGKDLFEKLETSSQRKKIIKEQKNSFRMQTSFIKNFMGGLEGFAPSNDFDDFEGFDGIDYFGDDDDFFEVPKQKPMHKQKIGRNEPCPCGSGKKYKQCCGRN